MSNLKPESQGYYGNLEEKTLSELKEMLARHTSLLKKEKFVQSLPDKGRKLHTFHARLTQVVAEREAQDVVVFGASTAQPAPRSQAREPPENPAVKKESSFSALRDRSDFPAECVTDREAAAATENKDVSVDSTVEDAISDSMRNMKVSSSTDLQSPGQDEHYLNSYDRVIRRAEEKAAQKRQPFKPHSDVNLKVKSVAEMPDDFLESLRNLSAAPSEGTKPEVDSGDPASGHMDTGASGAADSEAMSVDSSAWKSGRKAAHSHADSRPAGEGKKGSWRDEDLYPTYHLKTAKLIPMEESIHIQQEQQQKHETLRAQQAASRLASSLGIRMAEYRPESMDMQYRQPRELDSDDDDDDGDDDNGDYGEGGEAEELES